jgi:hypothetical protein
MLSLVNTVTVCGLPIPVVSILVVCVGFVRVAAAVGSRVMSSAVVRSTS